MHPTLKRVSVGAEVLASANLQVFGNSYANVAEAATTRFGNLFVTNLTQVYPNADFQIAKSGNVTFNLFSTNGNVIQSFGSGSSTFEFILNSNFPNPNVHMSAGAGVNNVYMDVDRYVLRDNSHATKAIFDVSGIGFKMNPTLNNTLSVSGNVFIDGNVYVSGTTTLNNVIQTVDTANTYSANAYHLTKFTSDISMSNGWAFSGSNTAHFAYGIKYLQANAQGFVHAPIAIGSPNIVASNAFIGSLGFISTGVFSNAGIFANAYATYYHTTSSILSSNGFLGLGHQSPSYPLDVRFSRDILNINLYNSNTDPAAYSTITLTSNGGNQNVLFRADPLFFQEAGGSLTKLKYSDWNQHIFRTQGQAQLAQLGTTGFKIGTGAAAANLDVTGNAYFTARVWSDTSFALPTSIFKDGGNLGINTIAPVANLHVLGNAYINTEMQAIRIFTPSIGVGTQAPEANIHNMGNLVVVGNTRLSSNLYISTKLDIFSNVFVSTDLFQFRSPQGISFPSGNIAQRGNKAGTIRYNEEYSFLEYTNDGSAWANVGSGSGSGGGSPWIESAVKNIYLNNTAANVSIGGLTSKSNLEVMGNVFVASNLAVVGNLFLSAGLFAANGFLGVGTTTPAHMLHVFGNSYMSGNLYVNSSPTDLIDAGITIQGSGVVQAWNSGLTGATRRTWGIKTETVAGDWSLLTSTAANTKPSVARVVVTAEGNVGVGTGTPTSNLHVVGNVFATANVAGAQLFATNGLILNANTLVANYTIAAGTNAVTVGPFVIPAAMNVTVSSGSRWVIL